MTDHRHCGIAGAIGRAIDGAALTQSQAGGEQQAGQEELSSSRREEEHRIRIALDELAMLMDSVGLTFMLIGLPNVSY